MVAELSTTYLPGCSLASLIFHIESPRLHHADDAVIVEFVMTGTQNARLQAYLQPAAESKCHWSGYSTSRLIA
jgi:hypothetical protein